MTNSSADPNRSSDPRNSGGQYSDASLLGTQASLNTYLSPQLLQQVLDVSILSCILVDAQAENMPAIYVNDAFVRTMGYSRAETIGQNLRFLQQGDNDQPGLTLLRQALARGESSTTQLRNYRKDGTLIWIELHIDPIYSPDGKLTHFVGFQKDISETVLQAQEREATASRLEAVLNTQSDLVIRCTLDLRLTYVNDAYCRYIGRPREELLGAVLLQTAPDAQQQRLKVAYQNAIKTGKSEPYIAPDADATGQLRWIQWQHYPIYDADGKIIENQLVGRDLTEVLGMQQLLAQREEMLSTILQHIPVMIGFFDQTGRFEYVNESWTQTLGYSAEEMRSHPDIMEAFYPDPDEKQAALDYMLAAERGWRDFKTTTQSGETVHTAWANVKLSDGRSIGIGVDISERKQFESDLQASEATFRTMFEDASEGIVLIDKQGAIVLVNHQIELMTKQDRAALIGTSLHDLIPDGQREAHHALCQAYMNEPTSRQMGEDIDIHVQREDGTTFPVEITLTPINSNGIDQVLCFIKDITEHALLVEQQMYAQQLELELDKERELLEMKDRFASFVSHEFRTPLSSIMISVDMLLSYYGRLSPDRVRQKLEDVLDQTQHMVNLMEDTLRFAQGRAGKTPFLPTDFQLKPFCEEVMTTLAHIDNGKHVLEITGDDGVIHADRSLMGQILNNLLTNALKYSEDGTTVAVSLKRGDHDWQIDVTDEGIGIPPQDLVRLYEAYHRADNAINYNGTGLGLAITKKYVELHGGTISVKTILGGGTTFIVTIPD